MDSPLVRLYSFFFFYDPEEVIIVSRIYKKVEGPP